MIDSKTLEKLEAIDDRTWGVIYKELVRYAQFKLDKAGFEIRTEKDSVDAEYFATLSIEKLFDGVRTWDYNRFPDVKIHLIGIVKSLISSHFKASTRSIISSRGEMTNEHSANQEEAMATESLEETGGFSLSPEEIIIAEQTWRRIEEAFGEKRDDYAIYSEWLDGTSPAKIAEAFEIPVSQINNAIKRGTRIVKSLFKKMP